MKACFLPLLLSIASIAVSAGTINYEGSSTIGKFIADADKIYPHSTFKINDDPESLGGEQCASLGTCDLGGVARNVTPDAIEKGLEILAGIRGEGQMIGDPAQLAETGTRTMKEGDIKEAEFSGNIDEALEESIRKLEARLNAELIESRPVEE